MLRKMFHQKGFTLAELLIVISILGVITTFTIPKILYAQASQHKEAIFKETIAMLSTILYEGIISGRITDGPSYKSYVMSHVNALKLCSSDSTTQGCWDTDIQGEPGSAMDTPGFILANGAYISGVENGFNSDGTDGIYIDYNGLAGPNINNQDQLKVLMCVTGPCSNIQSRHPKVSGLLGPDGTSATAYDNIFLN